MSKDMTLKLRILAMGDQAMKVVKAVGDSIKKSFSDSSLKGVMGLMGKTMGVVFAPLKYMAGAGLGLAGVFGAIGVKSVMAAAGAEKLYDRIKAVFGTEKDAKRAYDALQKYALASDFSDDELSQAIITMKQFGLASPRNLEIVASAARATDSSIEDMTKSIMTLQMRGLKSFGISMESKGDKTIFEYLDKANKPIKLIARNAQDAREAVLGIMKAKFGASLAPTTFTGFIKNIKNNLNEAFESFGTPLLAKIQPVIAEMAKKFQGFLETGQLEKWGEAVAGKIEGAFVWAKSVIEYAKGVFDALANQGAGAWGKAIEIGLTTGAKILAFGFMTYLSAGSAIFAAIGKVLASGFIEEVLKLDLWGMGKIRDSMAEKAILSSSTDERAAMDKKFGGRSFDKLTIAEKAELGAGFGREKMMSSAQDDLLRKIPEQGKAFKEFAGQEMSNAGTEMERAAGYKGPSFSDVKDKNAKAGMTINIGTLTVQANDEKQMQDRIMIKAGTPALAVAGT